MHDAFIVPLYEFSYVAANFMRERAIGDSK